ncbi:MAG: tetratricopeptide repeat protein [Pyrinomonadaceae bacterium]
MNKNLISLLIAGTVLLSAIVLTVSCSKQSAASSNQSTSPETVFSDNPQVKAAQEMISKSPDAPLGYTMLALSYIKLARESGDFSLNSKAESAVNRALEHESENVIAKKLQASLLLTFHRFPEALEAAEKLHQQYPQDSFIYGALADANVELGNYEEAVKNVQQMVDSKPNMESYARVSHVRSLYGDSAGAIEAMGTAAKTADPADKEARAWCRVFLGNEYFKAGKYADAELAYDLALKIFPEYHFALAGKGQTRMAAGDYENAIKFLTQSQDRVPFTETVIQLGDLYKKTGNAEKAQQQYQLAEFIEQKLGNIDMRRLALLWADQDTKLDEALAIAEKEHMTRKDIYTADIYAWCLYKKGRFDEAKKIMTEAMRLKTKDARIFYHAGMIEKELGNRSDSIQLLNSALKLNTAFDILQSENARQALQSLGQKG